MCIRDRYCSIDNLFMISSFDGVDPEAISGNYYPLTRNYSFGLNVTCLLYTSSSGTTAHDRKERTPRERASRERKRIEVPNDILHPELYRKITEWRGTKAKETGMPTYVIIQQKALLGMVLSLIHISSK